MLLFAWVSVASAGVYDQLKLRDGFACDALGTTPAVRDELLALAEGDVAPPYVPVRAAECLVQGFAEDPLVVERARAWVAERRWAGLGMVVADEEARFRLEDAVSIAQAARAAGDSRLLRRFSRSGRVEVRAVVDGAETGR